MLLLFNMAHNCHPETTNILCKIFCHELPRLQFSFKGRGKSHLHPDIFQIDSVYKLSHPYNQKKKKWQSCQLKKEFKSSVFASVIHVKERSLINFPKAEAAVPVKKTLCQHLTRRQAYKKMCDNTLIKAGFTK